MNDAEIIPIIERGLKVPPGTLTMDSSNMNIGEWDSLGHLGILIELDKAFEERIGKIQEMASAYSVKEIIALLKDNDLLAPVGV